MALDQAESELFRLEADLHAESIPDLDLTVEAGDILIRWRMWEYVIDHYEKPVNSIFHAAADKHLPMMERQVCEAARNNVVGTWNMQAAWRFRVSNFLLISTDKAVNPTSVMGLTKRVAELIVTARRVAAATKTADEVRLRPIRECVGEQWQRRADVPEADRRGRSRYRNPPRYAPLLYDRARSSAAGSPGLGDVQWT